MPISRRQIFRQVARNDRRVRSASGRLCAAEAPTEPAGETRVSGGDVSAAEPTEPAGETKYASEMGAQSVGRDLFSDSINNAVFRRVLQQMCDFILVSID